MLKEEKKKVKVLKDALKEGRKQQDLTEAELKSALTKIESLSNQMQEKVCIVINQSCRKKDTLICIRKRSN